MKKKTNRQTDKQKKKKILLEKGIIQGKLIKQKIASGNISN
jgi:hypothetical protein